MPSLDLILLFLLAASVLLGIWRGLVYELLSIGGWVLAYFCAQTGAEFAAERLPLTGVAEPLRYSAGFLVVFIVSAFAAGALAWLIRQLVEFTGLRPVDRVLGGCFGLLRGVVMLLALALLVNLTPFKQRQDWRLSRGAQALDDGLHALKDVVPAKLARYFP